MAEYIYDGKRLRKRSGQKEGELEKSIVKAWNGAKVGEIEGNIIRDAQGKIVSKFDGKCITDESGKKLATIEDIRKIVEGEAGIALAAMWYFFIWK